MSHAAIAVPPLSTQVVLGIELAAVGIVLVLGATRIRGRFPRVAPYLALLRTLALVGGITLVASAFLADATPETDLANPVPGTVTSVTAGAELFRANCASCHGAGATGDGPDAGTTPVAPANLRSGHLAAHTDGDIHYWIGAGLAGGMPGFAGRLSDTDRWDLVNYLRSINAGGPTPSVPGASAAPTAAIALAVPPIAILAAAAWLAGGLRRGQPRGQPRGRLPGTRLPGRRHLLVLPPVVPPVPRLDHLGPAQRAGGIPVGRRDDRRGGGPVVGLRQVAPGVMARGPARRVAIGTCGGLAARPASQRSGGRTICSARG